jgi:hypothetical protein
MVTAPATKLRRDVSLVSGEFCSVMNASLD